VNQYLRLLKQIRNEGAQKHPTRAESGATQNATIGLPNLHFSHDLADGFPLLTTRELNWAALVGELRSFLQGHDNHNEFKANNCGFWKPWAREDGSLGPVYGVQWNRHGQLQHVLDCLRRRPTDRPRS
jgi:thymidylate synthase